MSSSRAMRREFKVSRKRIAWPLLAISLPARSALSQLRATTTGTAYPTAGHRGDTVSGWHGSQGQHRFPDGGEMAVRSTIAIHCKGRKLRRGVFDQFERRPGVRPRSIARRPRPAGDTRAIAH